LQEVFRVKEMTKLSVNLNKVALLRNQRNIGIPSVIEAAKTVIKAGAYGITVHPRPDERHITYADVYEIAALLATESDVEFNIEGNPFTGKYMQLVPKVKPNQTTLVPDAPGANTSDRGWNLVDEGDRLIPVIRQLKGLGSRVSLFMDPDVPRIKLAKEIGADRVELYTEPYATAFRTNKKPDDMLRQYVTAAEAAADFGLGLNAGHDLNLKNLGKFCRGVPGLLEVSIGHALIADAIEMGLYNAVREYLKVLGQT
jgi:pyridoxine 5-phosphate synthase